MGLVKNLLPEEVIDQAEKIVPVFMRIPEEGPGALWEYIQDEAQSMKQMAMEGVRDAVITQLAIIGVQRLMNVLTLGGSAFADAAKGVQRPSPTLRMPRAGVLFFKNNWRKIVDLVTKIFNTLSTVADNDTKGIADGIEGTMGRGQQVIFGFFMTSLGLNGVVNTVINIFRKIGDFLRKSVQKGVDMVVNWVKDKFKGLFKRRGAGAEEEDDSQNQEDEPALTAADHARHERFANEMAIELKEEDPSKPSNFAEFYAAKQKLSRQLELRYNKRLGKVNGIPLKTTITMGSLSQELEDNDLDVKIKIAPNDTERKLPLPFVDADFMNGNENGWIVLYRGVQRKRDKNSTIQEAENAYKELQELLNDKNKGVFIHKSKATNKLTDQAKSSGQQINPNWEVMAALGKSTEIDPENPYKAIVSPYNLHASKWRAMVSHFVMNHSGFEKAISNGEYDIPPLIASPFISTSKRALQAAKYSNKPEEWKSLKQLRNQVVEINRQFGRTYDDMKESGRVYVYKFSLQELNQSKAIDIKKSSKGQNPVLIVNPIIRDQDEITFMGEIPEQNRVGDHVSVRLDVPNQPKNEEIKEAAERKARAATGGKMREWNDLASGSRGKKKTT